MADKSHEQKTKDAIRELRQVCQSLAAGRKLSLSLVKDVRNKAEIVEHLMSNPPILIEEPWP